MRIADMGDMSTHRAGRTVRCGNWHHIDGVEANGDPRVILRYVYHRGTCMGVLVADEAGWGRTEFVSYTMGWGSVSDQNGMNAVLRRAGLPLRYRRDAKGGGARYEQVSV